MCAWGGGGRLFPQPAPRYKRFYGKPLRQSLTRKCFRSMSIAPPITRFARRTRHAVKMSSLWTRCPRYLCRSRPSPNFIFSFARDPIVFSLALLSHSNNVDRWKERFRTRLLKISRRLPEYLTKYQYVNVFPSRDFLLPNAKVSARKKILPTFVFDR